TAEDVAAYYDDYRTHVGNSRGARRRDWFRSLLFYVAQIGVPGIFCQLIYFLTDSPGLSLLALVGSAVFWTYAYPKLLRRRYLDRVRKNKSFIGNHCTRITAEGFSDRTTRGAWTLFWPHVEDIIVTPRNLIFVTDEKWRSATPIPRHAFANSQEVKQFVERATAYWKQGTLAAAGELPTGPNVT